MKKIHVVIGDCFAVVVAAAESLFVEICTYNKWHGYINL